MNPSSNKESAGIQLPPPLTEQAVTDSKAGENSGQSLPKNVERPLANTEKAPVQLQPAGSAGPVTTIPLPLPTAASTSAVTPTTQAAALQIDDDDLIEKEWVNKAKQIVERTRDDPYKQSEEMTVFRADYMKKRYDKTIKVSQ